VCSKTDLDSPWGNSVADFKSKETDFEFGNSVMNSLHSEARCLEFPLFYSQCPYNAVGPVDMTGIV
jgi:hypothetical protein